MAIVFCFVPSWSAGDLLIMICGSRYRQLASKLTGNGDDKYLLCHLYLSKRYNYQRITPGAVLDLSRGRQAAHIVIERYFDLKDYGKCLYCFDLFPLRVGILLNGADHLL
jgi:hypothetical protein